MYKDVIDSDSDKGEEVDEDMLDDIQYLGY